ncbi:hypothetical protein M5K25_008105 [Dendrobium thyrsiflorum]|uniref:Non-haem dioxygenase N-terminal domain-containing protein n=1 Tax=Dendrobium thyrsiflorum TaxID=117978 RepID=A0ABD0VF23_DENTH
MAMEEISVPVIDLEKYEAEKEKLIIRVAVVGLGCFRVINHGITKTIIANMKVSARNILELSSEVKHRNTDVIPRSGYVYPNRLNPFFESLGIYDAKSTAGIHALCSCLGISSHDIEILSTYASALHGLIMNLASKIAKGLGIVDSSFQEWSFHLPMNRYNFTKETIVHYGANVHTDNSFINDILEDESNERFEMMNSNRNFVAVNQVSETFIINRSRLVIIEVEGILVPIIDLAKFEVEKEKLRSAVVGLGCFRVINHRIHDAIIADMKASARNILELPSEVKHCNINIIPGSGYIHPNLFSPLFQSLGIYDANSTANIHAFCSCLGISSHDM